MVPATSTPATVVGVPKSPVAAVPVTATVDAEPYRCEVSVEHAGGLGDAHLRACGGQRRCAVDLALDFRRERRRVGIRAGGERDVGGDAVDRDRQAVVDPALIVRPAATLPTALPRVASCVTLTA